MVRHYTKYVLGALTIVFLLVLTATTGQIISGDDTKSSVFDPSISNVKSNELAASVHELMNEVRGEHGLDSLYYDCELASIALRHSEAMVDDGFFDHVNKNGDTPTDRAYVDGFTCVKDRGSSYTVEKVGENLYHGWLYSSLSTNGKHDWLSVEELAEKIVDDLMNSPEHRANILDPDFEKHGLGVAITHEYGFYVTQDFC